MQQSYEHTFKKTPTEDFNLRFQNKHRNAGEQRRQPTKLLLCFYVFGLLEEVAVESCSKKWYITSNAANPAVALGVKMALPRDFRRPCDFRRSRRMYHPPDERNDWPGFRILHCHVRRWHFSVNPCHLATLHFLRLSITSKRETMIRLR